MRFTSGQQRHHQPHSGITDTELEIQAERERLFNNQPMAAASSRVASPPTRPETLEPESTAGQSAAAAGAVSGFL